jgi:hypothetical protein
MEMDGERLRWSRKMKFWGLDKEAQGPTEKLVAGSSLERKLQDTIETARESYMLQNKLLDPESYLRTYTQ